LQFQAYTRHDPRADGFAFMVLSAVPKRNPQGILEGTAADHPIKGADAPKCRWLVVGKRWVGLEPIEHVPDFVVKE